MADFSTQATDGADALITSYENTSDESSISGYANSAMSRLAISAELSTVVPTPARDEVLDAAQLLSALDQEARDTCADCSTLAPLDVSETVRQLRGDHAEPVGPCPRLPSLTTIPEVAPDSRRTTSRTLLATVPDTWLRSGSFCRHLPVSTQAPRPAAIRRRKPPADINIRSPARRTEHDDPRRMLPELPLPELPLPSLPLLGDLLGGGLLSGGQQ